MQKLLFIICLFGWAAAFSQSKQVTGLVSDIKGTPIIGAYIIKQGTSEHTHSNDVGKFQLGNLNPQDTLLIRSLGYEEMSYILKGSDFEESVVLKLEESFFDLDQIVITNKLNALNQLSSVDLYTNPVSSSQEVLRKVPGLFIAQHAGGGKAEQIFLRGFDIDHGTDINITVDGMPVNMVSHAHGQGYADLHFVIPETVDRIDFGKGPYYADKGNFTTAGYVGFETKEKLDNSLISTEIGQFNSIRTLGMFNLLENKENQHAYVAAEYLLSDGPFESSQNFNRINLMGKYTSQLPNSDKLSVAVSHFQSKWDASGQIPQRAIDNGTITRFGAIDDTEGGQTSRSNILVDYTKILPNQSFLRSRAYFSKYEFELFSNFTFFLNNPELGDQISQFEERSIFGFESTLNKTVAANNFDLNWQAGIGLRYDEVLDNELSRTANRKTTLEQLAFGDVNESNLFGFFNAEFDFGDWIINPGVRLDYFKFDYVDRLQTAYQTLSENSAFVSPNLNIIYGPRENLQLYVKSGVGFHSNDTRVVVAQEGESILPGAYGVDVGADWKPFPRMWINAAAWYLFLEQEFVYVGDEAIVEPSGKTRRLGGDFGLRYQLSDYIFFDGDINYTFARSIDEPEGADYIPLAPDLTSSGGLSFRYPSGFSGGIRYRYIKDRPANEDDSITAEGYFVLDLNAQYSFKDVTIGFMIDNLFDTDWNEAQFATESRLRNEPNPVEELHFTPGVPFFLRGKISFKF